MALAKFTIEMAAELGQFRRDIANINQVVAQMGGQIAQQYAPSVAALDRVGQAHKRVANEAQLAAMAQHKSTKMAVQQNIQLATQIQDFGIQVAGGQNPLLAFAQQGSQLYAVFGGVRPAIAAVTALITPMAVAMTGGAAAVGLLGLSFVKGSNQSAEFRRSLELTGNAAGLTAGRFEAAVQSIADNSDLGTGKVRDMAQALANTGRFGAGGVERMTQTAAMMVEITGKTAQEVAQEFANMADAPAAYAEKANKSLHFLTDAELQYIEKLEANGQRQKAVYLVQEALAVRYSTKTAENLGYLDAALKASGNAWNSMWDAAFALGREDTIDEKLKAAEDRLARIQRGTSTGKYRAGMLSFAQQEIENLKETARLEKRAADRKAMEAAAEQAATEKRRNESRLKGARESVSAALSELQAKRELLAIDDAILRLQGEQARSVSQNPALDAYYKEALAKQALAKIDVQRAAVQRELASVQGGSKPEDNLAAEQKRLQLQSRLLELDGQRSKAQAQLQTDLAATAQKQAEIDQAAAEQKEQARASLGTYFSGLAQTRIELEAQAQAIGKTALEQEKLNFARKLDERTAQIELEWAEKARAAGLQELEIEQGILAIRQEQKRALEAFGVVHADQYDRIYNAQRGAMEGLREYMESNTRAGENAKQAVTTVTKSMEDALTNFVSTGKLDMKGFVDTLIAEFTRLAVVKPLLNSLLQAGAGGFIANLFGAPTTAGGATTPAATPGYYGPAALGRVYGSPSVQAFAAGGAFTNRVVTHPKRLVEAGPEAVMPLQRDSRGRLGLMATVANGGGQGAGNVTVNVHTQPGQSADVQRRQDGNGNMTIDVILRQVQDGLADGVAAGSGSLYNAIGSRFVRSGAM